MFRDQTVGSSSSASWTPRELWDKAVAHTRTRSPLQKELGSLTKVLGVIAWTAVAFIFVVGLARGMDGSELLLLGTRLEVTEDPDDHEMAADDPRRSAFELYHWLSWLEQEMVDAVAR